MPLFAVDENNNPLALDAVPNENTLGNDSPPDIVMPELGNDTTVADVALQETNNLEAFKAGFKKENIIGQATVAKDAFDKTQGDLEKQRQAYYENQGGAPAASFTDYYFTQKADPNYNAFNDPENLKGYEDYYDSFVDSRSPEETAYIKARIDENRRLQQVIDQGSGWASLSGIVAGNVIDPTVLIPFVGVAGRIAKAGKIATAVKAGLGNAALAGAGEYARESVLREFDPTRTEQESAYNVAAVSMLSGFLGAGIAYKTAKVANQVEKDLATALKEADQAQSVGTVNISHKSAGSANALDNSDVELVNEGMIKRFGFGPSKRVMTSVSYNARRAIMRITNIPFLTKGMQKGKARPISIEDLIRADDPLKEEVITQTKNAYVEYVNNLPKDAKKLSFKQFDEEVAKALRRGDVSDIPQVAKAARSQRRYYNEMARRAQKLGLLPEDLEVKYAISYLPRVYDKSKIIKSGDAFKRELMDELAKNFPEEKLDYLDDTAQKIVDNIINGTTKGTNHGLLETTFLKERKLQMSDEFLEKWFKPSSLDIMERYHRSMSAKIAEKTVFGNDTLDDILQEVKDEYNKLIEANPKNAAKLYKQMERDIEDIKFTYRKATQTLTSDDVGYALDGKMVRATRAGKKSQIISKLGGVLLSSIPDLARLSMIDGMKPFLDLLTSIPTSKEFKVILKEKREIAAALEVAAHRRINVLAGDLELDINKTIVEEGLDQMTEGFMKATGLPYWNRELKTLAATLGENKLIKLADKIKNGGKISQKEIQKIARYGIGKDDLISIADQYSKYGKNINGFRYGNFSAWDNQELAGRVRVFLSSVADDTILTPFAGDLPKFMSRADMSTIFLFKSFLMASHNRVLLAGLQQGDAAFYTGLLFMVALGGVSTMLKDFTRLSEVEKRDPEEWLVEAIDRSGIIGLLFEANATMNVATGGRLSIDSLVSENKYKKWRTEKSQLFGPVFGGAALDLLDAGSGIITGDVKRSDVYKIWNNLPFQNLFYTRWLTDKVRKGLQNSVQDDGSNTGWK